MRIVKEDCIGLVIDMQEKLLPHMYENDVLIKNNEILIKGLQALEVPIIVTEQYTKGLGFTIEPVKCLFNPLKSIEKIAFSCCDEIAFNQQLEVHNKKKVIISGIETHVCVLQTCMDLLEKKYLPIVIENCVSSRKLADKKVALARIEKFGGIITTYESILFELTRFAGNETFKTISTLVK